MKSITVHNLDETLNVLLREKARQQGTSLNKTIKSLLADSLGLRSGKTEHWLEFRGLCGVWSAKEVAQFEKELRDFDKIDPEDWA